jgi:uncharacterized protein YrrD
MPRASSYEHRVVLSRSGKRLGTVGAVLYHPSAPRAIGIQIDRGSLLGMIDRAPVFAVLADVTLESSEAARLAEDKLPKSAAGERTLGYSWDDTVVWRNMPVRSADGEAVGVIADTVFDAETGEVTKAIVSTGVVGDVALGKLEVPGDLVRGFDGASVVVLPGYNEVRAGGGAAKVLAAGTAAVKVRSGQVADGALQVGVAASRALGRSLRSGTGRKALDKLKSLMGEDE